MTRIATTLALLSLTAAPLAAQSHYTLNPTGTEARYQVRELLAANTIENDVVGKTAGVTGGIALDKAGKVVSSGSKITIDLTLLKTDRDRRDGYVQRNTLETATHPNAVLVVKEITGLPAKMPTTGALSFTLVGDLTLKGVTKPTTWTVTATASPTGLTGTAKTKFTFSEFGIAVPRVPVVARVDDPIQLELDFNFVKDGK
ncbi:MAG: YceI family protein [Gemmatimonadetes bacterium]|nr:YceI family protein [Gemmatimonadota bacterium]